MSSRPNRETAYRVFAAEFDDATLSYAESDEERAPNYVVTPTGARLNRLFAVGVLTEIEAVNDEQLRARVVDPTGAFVVYAGQYQPEALSFLERAETPAFVAVAGKARTFQPEDSDRVFTSIRPESLNEVDAATRDRFAVDAAELTLERVRTMRAARDRDERGDALRDALEDEGVERGLAAGVPRALGHYDTTQAYLDAVEGLALDTARVVAGEREEVGPLTVAPEGRSTGGDAAAEGAEQTVSENGSDPDAAIATGDEADTEPAVESGEESIAAGSTDTDDGTASGTDSTGGTERETGIEAEPDREPESSTESETGITAGTDLESDSKDESAKREPAETTEPARSEDEREDESEPDDSFDGIDGTDDGIAAETDDEETIEANIDDPEEFEIDPDERERIEEEFGTDFESAAEVGDPGEADIETPGPEEMDEAVPESTDSVPDTEPASERENEGESAGAAADDGADEADDVGENDESEAADNDPDPEEAVVAAMAALNEGDGVDREAVVEHAVAEYGLTPEAADDGIQEALMSGECYEPDDDRLKPI
jgi:RPA family protein